MNAISSERLRTTIRLLWPDEITPTAKMVLESLCDDEPACMSDGHAFQQSFPGDRFCAVCGCDETMHERGDLP